MRYLILLLIFSYSCHAQSSTNSAVVEKVLKIPQVKKFLHTELDNRNPYYLLKNNYLGETNKLSIDGIPVIITEKANIKNENYLEITRFVINDDGAQVSIFYKIENIEISAKLKKENGRWTVENHKIFQF